MKKIVVVGAGVAGMTAAYLLAEAGHSVTVLESEDTVGGLARTFRYGEFSFDIGPHRFHTDDLVVLDFVRQVLKEDWTEIDRKSGVWMYGRYHDWPLGPSSLLKLPLSVMLRTGLDLFRRKEAETESFRDYILSMYGRSLYDLFFAPYTRKFIRAEPETIHADWAKSGVDRAVIDRRIQMNTLSQVIRGALLPKTVKTSFIYPVEGGISRFCANLAKGLEALGGRVLTKSRVVSVSVVENSVYSVSAEGGEEHTVDTLVWTAPINRLVDMLGLPMTWLSYISTVCYNYSISGPPAIPFQWCYYGQEDIVFNRLALPVHFSASAAPEGKCGVCAEVTCVEGDRVWEEPEKSAPQVESCLEAVRGFGVQNRIEALHVERIADTYPVYKMRYREELERVRHELERFTNLELLGRTATFWYNNMDHSIRMAIDLAEKLKRGYQSES